MFLWLLAATTELGNAVQNILLSFIPLLAPPPFLLSFVHANRWNLKTYPDCWKFVVLLRLQGLKVQWTRHLTFSFLGEEAFEPLNAIPRSFWRTGAIAFFCVRVCKWKRVALKVGILKLFVLLVLWQECVHIVCWSNAQLSWPECFLHLLHFIFYCLFFSYFSKFWSVFSCTRISRQGHLPVQT